LPRPKIYRSNAEKQAAYRQVRLSVGLEDLEDIIWDLDQALHASQSVTAAV
jgi:O-acetylhomoserine/O-acetylserine sulfhydrylase-like pyridoxal-dependent enzyme